MNKILIFLEPTVGKLKRVSYELITAGRNLAKMKNIPFDGIIFNSTNEAIQTAKEYGLSKVLHINDSNFEQYSVSLFAKAIFYIIQNNGYDFILFPANSYGNELAPRVAALLQASFIADCVGFDYSGDELIVTKPVYAGKAQIKAKMHGDIRICSLRPNVFTAIPEPIENISIENIVPNVDLSTKREVIVDVLKNEGKLDVLEADIVVSGGRGIKGPENYYLIEQLANILNGAVGASRAVVDAGWRPHSEQVGQTGKTVSPTLYIACGISGAIQHLAGMSTSKYILAINKDKDAPIFKVADYGIVGDLFNVIPKLIEKVKAFKE